jgi:hypothetical protein
MRKKKEMNVSGKIVPNFYIGHRKVWVEIYFWQMSNRISISRLTYGKFSRYNVKFFFRFSYTFDNVPHLKKND